MSPETRSTPLADAEARDAIATDLDSTLVVEAAAGTGKTTELVKRIVRILASGRASVRNLVAVTFTEKAAGELKLRLREAIDQARTDATDDAERTALNDALGYLEEAHVSTIHGFCAELLRERPVEAGVDPLFAVLTESQAARLFEEAFSGWMQAQLSAPPEGIRRALRRSIWAGFGGTTREDTPIDRLRRAAWDLAEWRDFSTPWQRPPFDRERSIEALIEEVRTVAAITESASYAKDPLYLDTAAVRHLASEVAMQRDFADAAGSRARTYDYDGWEARLVDLSRDRNVAKARHGRGPGYKPGVSRTSVLEALDALRPRLEQFRMEADADLAAALQGELRGALDRYETIKGRTGALDFLDLLLKARDLVRGNAGVRRGFQERFTHIFVDEFQDTDPLQAEILLLLASPDPEAADWRSVNPVAGRLFIVGDPKQSIYRFRRADVGIYHEVRDRLIAGGARALELTTSFRSVPQIQACINAAFAPIMTGDTFTLQASYVPLRPNRPDLSGQPAIVALPVPEPYGSRNLSAFAIEKSLPDAVGAFVEWLVTASGWKVTSRGTTRRVEARDVCILFRRFLSFGEDVTLPYVRALEARHVPHVLVGGKTFHDREEVEAIRAALAAVEWPDEELSVFATLRGPLFAVGDEELLDWKQRFHAFHPFRIPAAELHDPLLAHLRPIAEALQLLQQLHRRRNYRPIAETLQALLDATRAHVGFVLRAGGEQALANVLHIAELARQYEAQGGLSFRGFVDELRVAAESAQAAEAPILEEGSDGVRLMTVHKAKGLEFPVVILADLTCRLSPAEAGRWLDPDNGICALKIGGWVPADLRLHHGEELARDRTEAERLAYVAATRARDILVVPAVGDGPYEGWLNPINPAIYPPETERRQPKPARGAPLFASKDSVLNRPGGDPATAHTVAPGRHVFATSDADGRPAGYDVTWWDPRSLSLGMASSFGLVRDDLIVKDGDMFAVEERLADYEHWRDDRAHIVATASQPSVRVQTATAWAAEAAASGTDTVLAVGDAPIDVVLLQGHERRPRGPRFGTLVHAVLATVALDADDAAVEHTASAEQRLLNASEAEARAAAVVVRAVLRSDLLARVRASATVRRELPVSWLHPDGSLIEGVLDLAFDEGDRTIVIDFKTDHELATGEMRYRAQLQQYLAAVTRATGRPSAGVLFKI